MTLAKFVLMGGLISISESALWASEHEEPISIGSSGAVREKVVPHTELEARFKILKERTSKQLVSRKESQASLILATERSRSAQAAYQKLLEKNAKEREAEKQKTHQAAVGEISPKETASMAEASKDNLD